MSDESDQGQLVAGRYRLAEQIGRGGMGTVWRAEDEVLGRQVAVKRLYAPPHLSADEIVTLYERTRREARSAARIVHPNVVVVHDVVDDRGLPCIIMEYVASITLGQRLRGGRTVAPQEAARIGVEMTAALRSAHAAGVLHRDVKPGNVLLGADGRVVLTDFGIAMTVGTSTLTRTGEMVGSISYMAPERMRGHKPGPASDLWALGATLYQAVEGRLPFHRDTAVETAYAIAVDPLEPMKQAGALEPLIEALLRKEPEERPSAEQTEQALRATLQPGGATAVLPRDAHSEPPTDDVRTTRAPVVDPAEDEGTVPAQGGGRQRRRNRRRGRLVVMAVAVAAAVAAGGLYTMKHRDADAPGAATPSHKPSPVPDGFRTATEKGLGVSFPVPDGWKAGKRTAAGVTYTDTTGLAGLTIGVVDPAGSHPMAHFKDIEANTKRNYPGGYRKLRMQQTTFRGQPAAVWEFTFEGRVRVFRAIDLGFGREGGREYDIYLSAPDAKWDSYRPVFDKVRDGFTTTRS